MSRDEQLFGCMKNQKEEKQTYRGMMKAEVCVLRPSEFSAQHSDSIAGPPSGL